MFLVTGATGNVGGELVRLLADAGEDVRALTRDPVPLRLPGGVEVVTGDLSRPHSVAGVLAGVQGVFLLAGYADMPGLLSVIAAANVERVVLLSSGAVAGGDVANAVVRYNVVSEAALYDSGVAGTILRPSGFHSNALRWIAQLRAGNVIREPFGDVRVAAIAAVAALALTGPGHAGVTYRLTGPEPILPADRVAVLSGLLGRELRFVPIPDSEAQDELSRDMPPHYVDAFLSFFIDGAYDDATVEPTVTQLLGRAPRSFGQWAAAHSDAFR
jgi:uncharacterized protein YbjT (DUF2867 family)